MFVKNICSVQSFQNRTRKHSQLSFGSKNYPIIPFSVSTPLGPLRIKEIQEKDCPKAANYAFNFCIDTFRDWANYFKTAGPKEIQERTNRFCSDFKRTLTKKDGNSTILVATNQQGDIKALFSLENFDEFKGCQESVFDTETGYISDCFLSAEYRNQGTGSIILNKLLQTANGHFTDIYLEADNNAVNFYKRAGFLPLDTTNPLIKRIADYVCAHRDAFDEMTLMSKSLVPSDPWWQRVAKQIK